MTEIRKIFVAISEHTFLEIKELMLYAEKYDFFLGISFIFNQYPTNKEDRKRWDEHLKRFIKKARFLVFYLDNEINSRRKVDSKYFMGDLLSYEKIMTWDEARKWLQKNKKKKKNKKNRK